MDVNLGTLKSFSIKKLKFMLIKLKKTKDFPGKKEKILIIKDLIKQKKSEVTVVAAKTAMIKYNKMVRAIATHAGN